jgi:dienelactone hydrolase
MAATEQSIGIVGPGVILDGILRVPERATGLVLFAHGSGSGRLSPRNQFVAQVLNEAGLATLLLDLLTSDEECDSRLVFDLELLSQRLALAASWASDDAELEDLPMGLFGASTGAAAALIAAARDPGMARAVVSRRGRPDLAGSALPRVAVPTLLIMGGDDSDPVNRPVVHVT